jgi:hypothetical protein
VFPASTFTALCGVQGSYPFQSRIYTRSERLSVFLFYSSHSRFRRGGSRDHDRAVVGGDALDNGGYRLPKRGRREVLPRRPSRARRWCAIFATGNATDGTGYDAGNDYTEHAGWHGVYRGATVFHVFVCAWFATWVVLFVRCVVSSAVCAWYWARDGERETKLSEMSTWRAVRRTAMCHAGSLALLAFWMPVFFIPRLIVGFVCYFGGRTDKQTPPYSQVLAYRSAAVCQIALHGASLKVRVCISQIIASLF